MIQSKLSCEHPVSELVVYADWQYDGLELTSKTRTVCRICDWNARYREIVLPGTMTGAGEKVWVPCWAKWITESENGTIGAFETRPRLLGKFGGWVRSIGGTARGVVIWEGTPNPNWRDTLTWIGDGPEPEA